MDPMWAPPADETWFVPDNERLGSAGLRRRAPRLALLGAALAIAVAVRLAARRAPSVEVPFLARLAPWMPFACASTYQDEDRGGRGWMKTTRTHRPANVARRRITARPP